MKLFFLSALIFTLAIFSGCGQKENKVPDIDLHTAAATGNLKAIQQHISAGSDLDVKEHTRGSTPLLTAIVFGQTNAAITLINSGADINRQNNEGSSPLITAAFFCRIEIVKALLDKGADKSVRNLAGRTALDAVSRPFEDVKEMYDGFSAAFAPFGLKFDYEYIKNTRPVIAAMLQE